MGSRDLECDEVGNRESGINCSPAQASFTCINTVCSSVQIIDRDCLDHHMLVYKEALDQSLELKQLSFLYTAFKSY